MRSVLTLLFITLLCTCGRAQTPVTFGESHEIRSQVLAENRTLNVLLPTEYADSTQNNYPVVYLLDGATNEDFFHAAGLLRYLDDHGMMPPTILVGIANVDRKRDFTYPSRDPRDVADLPTSGGSANFINFLQNELTAYVDSTFRTTAHRTIVGQSLGGLLATEVLLKYPGTFNDYVIVSPSLWWDLEGLCQDLDSLVTTLTVYPERLFLSAGEEYPVMVDGSRRLTRLMEPHTKATFLPLMDEDHNTILHEALYRAFDGWYDPTVLEPYHFANAWDGLNLRSGPSLDSAVVAKLAYGASLDIISQQEEETVIDGRSGKWTYIGSDIGRGWVFDAYLSPVRVFTDRESVKNYATEKLVLSDGIAFHNLREEEDAANVHIRQDAYGNQLLEHNLWEVCWSELRLKGLTEAQARTTAENWLRVWGINPEQLSPRPIYGVSGNKEFFYAELETDDLTEWNYLRIVYAQGLLSIKESCRE